MELSVPFAKKVIEKSTEVVKDNINKIGQKIKSNTSLFKGINLKNWKTWVILAGALMVLFLLFRGMSAPQTETFKNVEEELPPKPIEYAIDVAKRHDQLYQHADGFEKIEHYHLATNAYERALFEVPPLSPEFGEIASRLGHLFHQGVGEQYDNYADQKIPGVPPDTEKAINYYQQAIQSGYHSVILDLASIFHWGNVGFKPNREYAKHLYGVVLKIGQEYEQGIARDRLRQMQEEEGKIVGSVLDGVEGIGNNFSSNGFNATPFTEEFSSLSGNSINPEDNGKEELVRDIDDDYVDEVITNDLHIRNNRVDDLTGKIKTKKGSPRSNKPRIQNDAHNARDHIVMNTVKQSLERLRASTHKQHDIPTALKMIHQYIVRDCDLNESKRNDAAKVLKFISNGMGNAGHDQAKELEALYLVYNRILSKFRNKKERENVLDNLVNELAECIEYGEVVCMEGRVNRIIDTLNFIDEDVRIKPKWALNQEMMNRAALMRKKMLDQSKGEVKDSLMSPNPTARQRMLARNFSEKLQREINREFTRMYVDSGIMSKDLLKVELDKWINEI